VSVATIVLGLLAAAFYGAADFCGGLATKRASMFSVALISQCAGALLLLSFVFFLPAHATKMDFVWGALGGLFGGIGLALLYQALSIGKMGVVSPITAVIAAAVPVVFGTIFHHEALAWVQIAGIAVALIAVVLISMSHEESGQIEIATAGVREAIACGLIFGGFYVFLGLTHRDAGLQPLLAARVASISFLAIVALLVRAPMTLQRATLRLVVFAGFIDMSANALYLLASHSGFISIAAVLTSLYPASTVLLARFILRERLQAVQKLGVLLALAGVALISA
jgi:drug/metabolite transporter (DMT)-like permease